MKKKRAVPISLIVTECILVVLFVFLYSWWFGFSYPFFEKTASEEAPIPGLSDGFAPQGLTALPEGCGYDFAVSGYLSGKPSRVYLIPQDRVMTDVKRLETYVTFTKAGEPVKTHFGGVAATEDYLYIASGGEVIRIPLKTVLAAQNGSAVEIKDSFSTGMGNAYVTVAGGDLYVGEFYRAGNYDTDPSHHISVGSHKNRALVYVYPMDEEKEGGIADTVPSKVLSVPNEVQGMAVTEEKIYLSCSYGLPDSNLRVYANPLNGEADATFALDGQEIPLYFFEDNGWGFRMPCMSEEICMRGGRLCILFESMSKQYRYVVHSRLTHIYSVDPAAIEDIDTKQVLFWGIG